MENTAQSTKLNEQETRPALPPAAHGRAPILYVLSGDDALLLELGPLLGTRYRTRPIESAEEITPESATPWTLMIDATARSDARAQAARVKQQYPRAPLLVICADGTAADWASPLARGALSAIVERSALGTDALDAALNAADEQMASESSAGHPDGGMPGMSTRRTVVWLVIVVASLAAAPTAWQMLSGHKSRRPTMPMPALNAPPSLAVPPAQPSLAPAARTAAAARTVPELLSDARVAFREGKSLLPPTDGTPTGNSALDLYAQVLAQDPQNDEARDGLRRLFAVASARIRANLNAGKVDEASRLLTSFRGVGIEPVAIAALESDIAVARPRALLAQAHVAIAKGDTETATQLIAQLAALGADRAVIAQLHDALDSKSNATRLTELANRARAFVKTGALLEPATDNAQSVVLSMQQLNRNSPLTLNAEHELQAALIERTLSASRGGHFELAQQLLNSAAILGNSPELAAARTQLQSEIEATRVPDTATAAAVPAPVAAAAAEPEFVRAKPLAPLEVTYPQRAFDAGQQGYVVVEFTLDAKGHASDAKIVESKPARVFDEAALQAVKHGYFDTSELGGSGASRRARLRIAFKPAAKQPAE